MIETRSSGQIESDSFMELDAEFAPTETEAQVGPDGPRAGASPDPIQNLREQTINVLIPVFVELVTKYSPFGISMEMDAADFLEGGRHINLDFSMGEYRMHLIGTVTQEAVAFHETRHSPDVLGDVLSGPMLRLRGLSAEVFREFICERLGILLRAAARRPPSPASSPE